jgi:phytoene dehydrogenase-like protein
MSESSRSADVAIAGGGLAGLAAAALLARADRKVTLFERGPALGGRAATHRKGDFCFNQGPHALYRTAAAAQVLRDLGVSYQGAVPSPSGAFALDRGAKHALPGGFFSLVTTSLLGLSAKLETARLLASINKIDAAALESQTVSAWLEANVRHSGVRRLVAALVRLTSYANDPDRMSAGAALAQLQKALAGGVLYLDGGWQTLVDGLGAVARQAGVTILTGARVVAVEHDGAVRAVRLADGTSYSCSAAIVAAAPSAAADLVGGAAGRTLRRWADEAIPVKAACLDLGLSRLPQPQARFALGIDSPTYFSVHSAVARLAPEGGALIHVAKYLGNPAGEAKEVERELEGVLDMVQPGWREVVVERRFLPAMTVVNALPAAAAGGTSGRPGVEVREVRNLYVTGDWVGPEGLLADASFASARRAAEVILAKPRSAVAAAA